MGIFFMDTNEIEEEVKASSGDTKDYLFTIKHDDFKTGLAKWLALNTLLYSSDASRNFTIYFSPKGIYEKEKGNPLSKSFVLLPWNEIEDVQVEMKSKKAFLVFWHLVKRVGYEVPFNGRMCKGNEERLQALQEKNWNRVD